MSEFLEKLMVKIPEGQITLRDDRIKKQWNVEVKSFLLSRYLVTQELYAMVIQKNPSEFKGDLRPVESVSWKEAVEFCNLLSQKEDLKPCYLITEEEVKFDAEANGFRLPNEGEWEYACKAGSVSSRYGELDLIAWYRKNANGKTQYVGRKDPNNWGLYDMLGNVWEWCNDIYEETVYGSYRIIRGGGWNDEERGCLATNRRRSHPKSFKIDDLGFRIAKNL
ncbi:formylglycine-generating enzyme family protein [Flexithrix dorotheae]|uniref:formylglycine-generating enzyme family protein n=1 Tax=Flexithrix dorotheae TaxID=70993 RepID=UPI00039AD1F8|nr:SUMF1/EgtB/PvdO family nonheme iron enzyme [Flexithrix dorotheae]